MQHSQTPWYIGSEKPLYIRDADGNIVSDGWAQNPKDLANAQRIVECVNALAGYDNPSQFMDFVDQLKRASFAAHRGCEDRDKEIASLMQYNAKLFAQLDALVKLTDTIPSLTYTPEYQEAAFTVRTTCEHSDAAQDEPEFETPENDID